MIELKVSGEAEVLRLLKGATRGYVSGTDISGELRISRTSVWKRIKKLKKMGYAIESIRARGYRLAETDGDGNKKSFSGVEVLSGLTTETIGRDLHFYNELPSTNIKAMELAAGGAPEGTAVIADTQTGGKGRLGREWFSPPGVNLYTSVVFRPDLTPPEAPILTLVFAVAVAEATEEFTGDGVELKWPNDLLLGKRKVAGILTEMNSDMDRVISVVCGIGVNLNMPTQLKPDELSSKSISIKEYCGLDIERARFAQKLYSSLERWYKIFTQSGFPPVAARWRDYFGVEGKKVSVNTINSSVEGICLGIDDDGRLLIREPGGVVRTISSGDMDHHAWAR